VYAPPLQPPNTHLPRWPLAQPMRLLGHKTGNQITPCWAISTWAQGRRIPPRCRLGCRRRRPQARLNAPSAILQSRRMLELMVRSGRPNHPMPPDLVPEALFQRAAGTRFPPRGAGHFYEVLRPGSRKPWMARRLLVFSDGTQCGCFADRNGLRPGRVLHHSR